MTDERKKEIVDMYKKYGFAIKFEGNYCGEHNSKYDFIINDRIIFETTPTDNKNLKLGYGFYSSLTDEHKYYKLIKVSDVK